MGSQQIVVPNTLKRHKALGLQGRVSLGNADSVCRGFRRPVQLRGKPNARFVRSYASAAFYAFQGPALFGDPFLPKSNLGVPFEQFGDLQV